MTLAVATPAYRGTGHYVGPRVPERVFYSGIWLEKWERLLLFVILYCKNGIA